MVMYVVGLGGNGPAIVDVEVEVTKEQRESGEHYDMAMMYAEEENVTFTPHVAFEAREFVAELKPCLPQLAALGLRAAVQTAPGRVLRWARFDNYTRGGGSMLQRLAAFIESLGSQAVQSVLMPSPEEALVMYWEPAYAEVAKQPQLQTSVQV